MPDVTVRMNQVNFPLAQLYWGQNSAVTVVAAGIPESATSAALLLVPIGGTTPDAIAGVKQADGTWRFFISALYTQKTGATTYELVYAAPEDGQEETPTYWAGRGAAVIMAATMTGSDVVPSIIPRNSYAYDPDTKLYHLITAVKIGKEITISVAEEGVSK